MNFMKVNHAKLVLAGVVAGLLSTCFTTGTTAQESSDRVQFNQPTLNTYQLARRGAPRGRSGAGTRGDCPAVATDSELVVLVPESSLGEQAETIPLGLTSSSRPTLWFYVPYDLDILSSIQFVVLDEAEAPISEPFTVSYTRIPGVVGFQIPESVSLKPSQYYRWYLLIDCQPASNTDIFVEGFIRRVELESELVDQLTHASPRERIALYAENGIWYDALTELQTLRQNLPNDRSLESDWAALLESVGLGQLVSNSVFDFQSHHRYRLLLQQTENELKPVKILSHEAYNSFSHNKKKI